MHILLVEDDLKIATFVESGLKSSGFTVDHVKDGEEALCLIESRSYEMAIIDIMLPKVDGLTVIQTMREKSIHIPVIILSAKHSIDDRVAGLQRGGDDYLTKPFSMTELLARIQALHRRAGQAAAPTRLTCGDVTLDLLSKQVTRGETKIELHAKELSLLEYLMRNQGRVMSKSLILEHVWSFSFDPQTNVVDVLVCRLRNKVDKGFSTKTIHTIRGLGYVFRPN